MERPQHRPTVDLSTFQKELAKLRADVDTLATVEKVVLEPTPDVDVDDKLLSALFEDDMH